MRFLFNMAKGSSASVTARGEHDRFSKKSFINFVLLEKVEVWGEKIMGLLRAGKMALSKR